MSFVTLPDTDTVHRPREKDITEACCDPELRGHAVLESDKRQCQHPACWGDTDA